MSVTLIENPVVTEGGVVKNLFDGFGKVEFKFSRQDQEITGIGQGISNQILIQLAVDLSTYLNVGDSVYYYSEGATYTYDDVSQVVAITATTITLAGDFIETATGGYINYYRNYYLDVELVNEDNSDIKILPFSLRDDGDNQGNITIDVSIANDLNIQFFEFIQQELTDSRIIFKVQYREVWDDTTGSFTLIDDRIILVYATQQPDLEAFINELDEPKLWLGYPYGVILVHSDENSDDDTIEITYDELDINQSDLVTDIGLGSLVATKEGFIFINIDKDTVYNSATEYIKLNGTYAGEKFFSPSFFDDNYFKA